MAVWCGLATTSAHAQVPTAEAFEAAVHQARPLARSLGLNLHGQTLWLAALRARVPMLALRVGSDCHLGYAAYTPGQDYSWLFPELPPEQRQAWLQGFVQHEVAHCAQQSPHAAALAGANRDADGMEAAASARLRARDAEVLADLAFARHQDRVLPADQADGLIDRLARLRESRRDMDPSHDTSSALDCHRQHPLRHRYDMAWPQHLQALSRGCAGAAASR